MVKEFAAVARQRAGGEAQKERDQNLRSHRPCGREWQIQEKLAAMDRWRARSSVARSVAGWFAEWLGGRASRIMGIEGGLSNKNFRLDFHCSWVDRDDRLARQNTLKTVAAKRSSDPSVNAAPLSLRREFAYRLFGRAAASGRETAENTGQIVLLRFCIWNSPALRKLVLEKSELCKIV